MTTPRHSTESEPDTISAGVDLSTRQLRAWPILWQHVYAALVLAGWILIVVTVVVIVVVLATATFESPSGKIVLAWVGLFGAVVMSWLLWNVAVPLYADVLSHGRFSAWRSERLARFDRVFNIVALVLLVSIVLLPVMAIFE